MECSMYSFKKYYTYRLLKLSVVIYIITFETLIFTKNDEKYYCYK